MTSETKQDQKTRRKRPPATTPEARENQLAALAYDLAEKQLADGTASSQVMTHFLKAASSAEKLEQDIRRQTAELMKAKTEAIQSAKRVEELYKKALNAMRLYTGARGDDEDF